MTPSDLRDWRLRLGMTQKQAAEALGRSVEWVSSAETHRRPIHGTVVLLCQAIEQQRKKMEKN